MEPISIKSLYLACGVPQRREKCLGNGVKNLSGSADIPKSLIMIIDNIDLTGAAGELK